MVGRLRLLGVGVAALTLAACGGTGIDESLADLGEIPDDVAADTSTDDPVIDVGGDGDTGVVVTIDGAEYRVDTEFGGSCSTEYDPERETDLKAYGYDVETGIRVELSFSRQSAEFSPSGEEEYYGGFYVASSPESWQVQSLEPWPWIDGDRSTVSGSVTMEDGDGGTADIEFEVTCP